MNDYINKFVKSMEMLRSIKNENGMAILTEEQIVNLIVGALANMQANGDIDFDQATEIYNSFMGYDPEPEHLYKITFSHTKAHRDYGKYTATDWMLFEGKDESEAKANAKAWVKENRFADGCRNYVKIIRCVEIKPEA